MADLLWIVAIIFLLGWAIDFFIFETLGALIHILLVVGLIFLGIKLFGGKKSDADKQ